MYFVTVTTFLAKIIALLKKIKDLLIVINVKIFIQLALKYTIWKPCLELIFESNIEI